MLGSMWGGSRRKGSGGEGCVRSVGCELWRSVGGGCWEGDNEWVCG